MLLIIVSLEGMSATLALSLDSKMVTLLFPMLILPELTLSEEPKEVDWPTLRETPTGKVRYTPVVTTGLPGVTGGTLILQLSSVG